MYLYFFFYWYADSRALTVLTHFFPIRRSSDRRVPRSCGAVPEGHVARRIALGASRGTWRKLQEHLLQVWRHQRFADRLEAVLPAPELDADRKSTRLNSSH